GLQQIADARHGALNQSAGDPTITAKRCSPHLRAASRRILSIDPNAMPDFFALAGVRFRPSGEHRSPESARCPGEKRRGGERESQLYEALELSLRASSASRSRNRLSPQRRQESYVMVATCWLIAVVAAWMTAMALAARV